ncbi:MAG: ABC transporter permease [Flavobacteriia bacterium]|nr:ABC transporter permease [Flavobacteriia bacterium]
MRQMNTFKLGFLQVWKRRSRLFVQWTMVCLGLALVSGFFTFEKSTNAQLVNDLSSIDQVWCAKGSPLQGLLANVYHIDNPTGNISLEEVNQFAQNGMIERVTRIAYGDVYKGRRILGADESWSDLYNLTPLEGKLPEAEMEVALSQALASELGLGIGDSFHGQHGDTETGHEHEEHYTVTGIFENTGTVADRILLTSLSSVWQVHHSDADNKEITAALVETTSPMALFQLPRMINSKSTFQAVLPSIEVNRIHALFGNTQSAFIALSALFLLLGALSIGITIHETVRAQQFDHTLLRVFGLSPLRLAVTIWTQTLLLLGSAWVAGMLLIKIVLYTLAPTIALKRGLELKLDILNSTDLLLLAVSVSLGLIIAVPPVIRIFRTTIHQNLKNA